MKATVAPTVNDSVRPRPERLKGITALLFGVGGLVVGIGLGLRWLRAGVVTWESVAATAALAMGLVLTPFGLSRVTRGLQWMSRLTVGLLSLLVVAVLVWTLAPAVIATNIPPSANTPPIDLGPGSRQVHFSTSDGVRLWGWYVPPPDGRVAVVRHGSGSTASDVTRQAAVLVDNGYGVLITDARGHGRSEGEAMDFGWYGESDIEAAVDFLVDQHEVDPSRIAVLGLSMGGEEAIGAAGSDDRIAAVVAEGATARTHADKVWLIEEYGWRGWIQVRLEWLQYGFTDLLTAASQPPSLATAAVSADPTPILMVTAGDLPDEGKAAAHLQETSPDNVTVWTIPGSGHVDGLSTAPAEWERTVIGFLEGALDDR